MFRAPSLACLPHLSTLLDDLQAPRAQVARHLGISPVTLARYEATGQAPRPVMLALFWETRWGRSAADCEATNWATLQGARADVLQRHTVRLRERIATLEALIDSQAGQAANQPFFVVA